MNKKEFVSTVVQVLAQNGIRKHVPVQKAVLHVSDDSGNTSDFIIKKDETTLMFSNADVSEILEAMLAVAEDAVKHGEDINFHGFGTLGVKYREATNTYHPATKEPITIRARYVPKFNFGNALRRAARIYQLSVDDQNGLDTELDNNGD